MPFLLLCMVFFLSSCSFPSWIVSHRHITVESTSGKVPEVTHAQERVIRKSRYEIYQYFRSDTLRNLSEQSFSVLYHGERIKPDVYAYLPNNYTRLKEPTTLPPMTLYCISFKVKRQHGDTILITGHDIPQQGDSLTVRVEIPEERDKKDAIDWRNFELTQQLYGESEFMTSKGGLYHDLAYENGVCIKEFVVTLPSTCDNILHGEMTEDMKQIMKQEDVPLHALSFYYNYNFYRVSVSNDCDLSLLKNKDRQWEDSFKIRVKFYENVKEPYKQNLPFAIIESISAA